jgi:hypothetical protein
MTFHLARGYIGQTDLWNKTVSILIQGGTAMIYVGIDVAKDKHDCLIVDSDGVILFPTFTIPNNRQGFDELLTNLKNMWE